jgi:cell division protease FtsH
VGDREQQIFLGREIQQRREVSERTAELVDQEVKRFLDHAYVRAREILQANMETLHRMAAALLERETLDREEVTLLAEGKALPPRPPAAAPAPALPAAPEARPRESGARPILGTPPAEPAGA